MADRKKPGTLGVRAGGVRSDFQEHSEALVLTTSFVYKSAAEAARKFANEEQGNIYTRFTNPTVKMFQDRLAALEVAAKLKRQYTEGFIKNRYIGRTFIMPGQEMRRKSVRQKLNAMAIEFKDKNVLLVDDSIVRGTTSREIVQMARESGAKKVFFASAAPPVRYPNVYGIDMPTRAELIATGRTEQEIATLIGADAVIYQDLDALIEDVRSLNPSIERFDCSCFDGIYVTGDVSPEYLEGIESGRSDGESGDTRLSSYQLDLGLSRID